MIQKASIVYELLVIVCWNKIYSPSMMSLCSIIQDHTINQYTWLLLKKPSYRQEWMSSLQIRYSKRGIIDGTVKLLVFMLAINYGIFSWPKLSSREPESNQRPMDYYTTISDSTVHRSANWAIARYLTDIYQINYKN